MDGMVGPPVSMGYSGPEHKIPLRRDYRRSAPVSRYGPSESHALPTIRSTGCGRIAGCVIHQLWLRQAAAIALRSAAETSANRLRMSQQVPHRNRNPRICRGDRRVEDKSPVNADRP